MEIGQSVEIKIITAARALAADAAILVLAFIVVPIVATPYVFSAILIPFLILSLAAIGLNILTGYAGQFFAWFHFLDPHDKYQPHAGIPSWGSTTRDLYGTFGYPETYIIDANGVLRRKFIGPVDWTKPEIIEYLQKL